MGYCPSFSVEFNTDKDLLQQIFALLCDCECVVKYSEGIVFHFINGESVTVIIKDIEHIDFGKDYAYFDFNGNQDSFFINISSVIRVDVLPDVAL